jgi:hypothetical protein
MSSRPSATIGHEGRHACNLVRITLVRFTDQKVDAVLAWCRVLGVPFEDEVRGLEQLRRIVAEAPTALASLPAVAPVVPPTKSEFRLGLSDDPRLALSVLCRCSDRVFIRGKSPMVTLANLCRDIAIVLPLKPEEPAP